MRSEVYSGHMRKAGKKKTRYTDAEIAQIKKDAYEQGRSSTGEAAPTSSFYTENTERNDGYNAGHQDGKRTQLAELEEWITTADGRPGKRQVLDKIAQLKQELDTHA